MQSGPVAVGKARFVGFSWPDPDPSAATGEAGLWLRARTTAGWSAWREVERAADGPDKTSQEYRPGRLYSDGQGLDAGTTEVQVRVDPPAPADAKIAGKAAEAETGTGAAAVPASGLEAHLITPGYGADARDRAGEGRGGDGGDRAAEDREPGRVGG